MVNIMTNKTFGKIEIAVAGVTFENRQGKLWNLRKAENAGQNVYCSLRREPKNERDTNAIAVIAHTENSNFKIGYVPANVACWLAKRMDNGLVVRAYATDKGAKFVHGNKGQNLGVALKVVYELGANEVAKAELDA